MSPTRTIRAKIGGLSVKAEIGPNGVVIKAGGRVLKAPPPEPLALSPIQKAARQREAVCRRIFEIYKEHGFEWLWSINPMSKYSFSQLAHHLTRLLAGKFPWKIGG